MRYLEQEAFNLFGVASDLRVGQYGSIEHLYSACHDDVMLVVWIRDRQTCGYQLVLLPSYFARSPSLSADVPVSQTEEQQDRLLRQKD